MVSRIKRTLKQLHLKHVVNKHVKQTDPKLESIPTRCPNCLSEVSKVTMYGQKSYSCSKCLSWGPWKNRVKFTKLKN